MTKTMSAAPAGATQLHAQRVLVLDGAPSAHLQSVRPVLDSGHVCLAATSVDAALTTLAQQMPQLVLCDPSGVGGWEACARLIQTLRRHEVPVVMMVEAQTAGELVEAGHRAGVNDCIVRPVRLHHITTRLHALTPREATPVHHGRGRVAVVGAAGAFLANLGSLLERFGYRVARVAPEHASSVAGLVPPGEDWLVLLGQDAASRFDEVLAAFVGGVGAKRPPPIVRVAEAGHAQDTPWLSADVYGLEAILDLVSAHFHRASVLRPRLHECTPLFRPLELRELDKADAPWSSGYASDLSAGGLCVRTLVPPRLRSCVELRIHLGTFRELVEVKCVVAWSNPWPGRSAWAWQAGAGLQFLGMAPRQLSTYTASQPQPLWASRERVSAAR